MAVSRVESGQAVLVVKTDVTSTVTVDYGTAPGVYSMASSSVGRRRHELNLTSLPSSARIYYRVTVVYSTAPTSPQVLTEKSFSSFKTPGNPFSYAVAGDNRPDLADPIGPAAAWVTIVAQMSAANTDLALHTGDIILADGSDTAELNEQKYEAFFSAASNLTATTPLYAAPGNHERLFDPVGMDGFTGEFTLPVNDGPDAEVYGELYYSFDYGDTHFIVLCSEIPGEYGLVTGNQLLWLEADLAANTMPWTVVAVHQPLFGQSGLWSHSFDPWANPDDVAGQQNRADIISLFRQNGVDVVFHGHDHYYKHHVDSGIHYIVTGGAGSPLYALPAMVAGDIFSASSFHHVKVEETAASMTISAVSSAGTEMERFTLGTPALGLATNKVYWANYSDYEGRELSVDYSLDNRGSGDALDVRLTHSQATNGVLPLVSLPVMIGDLDVTGSAIVTVKYLVPFGVSSFKTVNYAACDGNDGVHRLFPGTPPAN